MNGWDEVDPHHLCAFPPRGFTLERAQGVHIETGDGRRFVDLGGASQGVAILGHGHPRVVEAIRSQAGEAIHVAQTVVTQNRASLLDRLHGFLPDSLRQTFLTNSGTEAVECALKLSGWATGRTGLVAAKGGFHGRSLGALRVTHRPEYRRGLEAWTEGTRFVPLNDEEALQEAIDRETAAFFVEPIQGEGGIHVATPEYLKAARDLTQDAGALLVFDEIQTGLGRTGTFLAAEAAGVVPDIVLLGKGLAGGFPMAACSVTEPVAQGLPKGAHGSTYGGGPLACAAGAAALNVMHEEELWSRAQRSGQRFIEALQAIEDPRIREVRGRGLMVGVDLRVRAAGVVRALEDDGFLALTAGKSVVRFLPPLVIEDEVLQEAASAFERALEAGDKGRAAGNVQQAVQARGQGA